jgi:hypothetical protein
MQSLVYNVCTLLESAAQLLQLSPQPPAPSHPQQQTHKTPAGKQLHDTSSAGSTDQHQLSDQQEQQLRPVEQRFLKLDLQESAARSMPKMHVEFQASSHQVAHRMKEVGEALLGKAEPRLAQLRCWPRPAVEGFSQHQLVESVQEAYEALAAAQQATQQQV